jgi:hypothetical protein
MFDVDHFVLCLIDGFNNLVQLQVNSLGVPVLRILDQKNHQERDDSGACIDDELPRIRILKIWTRNKPSQKKERRGMPILFLPSRRLSWQKLEIPFRCHHRLSSCSHYRLSDPRCKKIVPWIVFKVFVSWCSVSSLPAGNVFFGNRKQGWGKRNFSVWSAPHLSSRLRIAALLKRAPLSDKPGLWFAHLVGGMETI